jgi:hypothetical protein
MGLNSSTQKLFEAECVRISSDLYRLDNKPRPREKAAILNDIYGKSPFLKYIRDAHNSKQLYSVRDNMYVSNPFEAGFMGLLIPDFLKQRVESTLLPLLNYFLNIQSKQNNLSNEKGVQEFISADTLRTVIRNEFKLFSADLKLGSSIFTDELFSTLVAFIKNSKYSYGIRIVSKSIRDSVWEKYDHVCYACLCNLHTDDFEMAHISSTSGGGLTVIPNLRPCCFPCNRSMGEMNLYEYVLRNDLKGKSRIPADQAQLWQGLIFLTDYVARKKPEVTRYQVVDRLRAITEFIALDWK